MRRFLVCGVLLAALAPTAASAAIINRPINSLGLVGYWSFNELTGTTAADTSGKGNSGTLNGSPTHVAGVAGNALHFNGSNYVSATDAPSLNPTGGITISAWINADDWSDNHRIIQKGDNDDQYRITQEGAVFRFDLGGVTGGGIATTPPSAGQWHHIVGTYDGATIALYIDGALAASQAASGQIAVTPNNLHIGTKTPAAPAGDHFPGQMDEIRIYNRGLSATEITALYKNRGAIASVVGSSALGGGAVKNGLIGHWTFDGPDFTTTVTDRSGRSNNGYLYGAASSSAKVGGRLGQALRLVSGNSSNVRFSGADFNIQGAVTVCAWFKQSSGGANALLLSNGDSSLGSAQYVLKVTGTGQLHFGWTGADTASTNVTSAASSITVGQWYFGCGTRTAGNVATVYINGANANAGSAGSDPVVSSPGGNPAIGGSSIQYFNGVIDDMRVYNRALSAAEILQLYNLGGGTMNASATKMQKGTTLSSGLVAHYTFDNLDMQTSVRDVAGGYNGQVNGAATSTIKAAGKLGQAIRLDGSDDFIATTTFNQTLLPATIAHWAKVDGTGLSACDATVFSRAGGDVSGINLPSCQSTGKVGYHWKGTPETFNWAGGSNIPIGKWFLVALVVESDKATLYVYSEDGLNSAVNAVSHTSSTLSQLKIGQDDIGSRFYKGLIDDVRIYNRALSADEVKQLYNLGK